ncbi:MAG: hypothetical protein K0S33_4131 [Bacteroidetes bacterium]|jgi:hypothetical protein|nr:hypothetical protein [Bacteroidota bacterium]
MERLNYFNPYSSKESYYEDQLTRAYLVLLKHSFHVFSLFIDYCKAKHTPDVTKSENTLSLAKFIETGWDIHTQRGNPIIDTDWLLSVLITDTDIVKETEAIIPSERNAIYDGLITFGKNTSFIIENKPRSGNVWFGQLNPTLENLSDETRVYSQPIILEWKEIIKQLNLLLSIPTLSGYEKMMIDDFLAFIDQNFPYLNPFDNFSLCKGNHELIYRRIYNLLQSIVLDPSTVQMHRGWGYHIKVPFPEIREIGLILVEEGDKWHLELSLYFGATQTQAKAFYSQNINLKTVEASDWEIYSNFHVAYRSSNLVWFKGCGPEKYIEFWQSNITEIYQNKKNEVREYIDWLYAEEILIKSSEVEAMLQQKFYDTNMQTLNICPEIGFIYPIESEIAETLDKKGKMEHLLKEKIIECLKIANINSSTLLKP